MIDHYYVFQPVRVHDAAVAQGFASPAFIAFFGRLVAADGASDVGDTGCTGGDLALWLDFWVRAGSPRKAVAKVRARLDDAGYAKQPWDFGIPRVVGDRGRPLDVKVYEGLDAVLTHWV